MADSNSHSQISILEVTEVKCMFKDDLHSKRRALLVAELNDLQAYHVVLESRLDSEDSSLWRSTLNTLFGTWLLVGKPTNEPRSLYVVAKQSLCLTAPRVAAIRLLARPTG